MIARSLTVGGVTLRWRPTPWDQRALGVATVELLDLAYADPAELPGALAGLDAILAVDAVGLATTRVDAADAPQVAALAAAGWAAIETSHALALDLAGRDPTTAFRRTVEVEPATAADRAALVALARDGFDYSRFHEDPRIHPDRSRDRYARWIADSLDASLAGGEHGAGADPAHRPIIPTGDEVWIHRHRGALAAVMTFRRTSATTVQLLLGGTSPGLNLVAPMFWTGVLARLRREGIAAVATRVSAANHAALRLHLALGFTVASTDAGLTRIYPPADAVLSSPLAPAAASAGPTATRT